MPTGLVVSDHLVKRQVVAMLKRTNPVSPDRLRESVKAAARFVHHFPKPRNPGEVWY